MLPTPHVVQPATCRNTANTWKYKRAVEDNRHNVQTKANTTPTPIILQKYRHVRIKPWSFVADWKFYVKGGNICFLDMSDFILDYHLTWTLWHYLHCKSGHKCFHASSRFPPRISKLWQKTASNGTMKTHVWVQLVWTWDLLKYCFKVSFTLSLSESYDSYLLVDFCLARSVYKRKENLGVWFDSFLHDWFLNLGFSR